MSDFPAERGVRQAADQTAGTGIERLMLAYANGSTIAFARADTGAVLVGESFRDGGSFAPPTPGLHRLNC